MRRANLALGAGLLALAVGLAPERRASELGPALLLTGPARTLARDLEWVRFQRARLAGHAERALAAATRAIALDPEETGGWRLIAQELAFHGSPTREPALERRRRFVAAALEALERGRTHAREPGLLDFDRGVLLFTRAELDPEIDEGGAASLFQRAAEAFEDAARAGVPEAAEVAAHARESAAPAE